MTRQEYEGILAVQLGISRLHSVLSILIEVTDDGKLCDSIELCVDYARTLQRQIDDIPGVHAAAIGNPTKEGAHG
jgi:DNA-binding XRE family transcriptional regulator